MDDGFLETLETDDALGDAAAVVLDRAESGDGTVTWADVSDAVPAEQWGRLLESGAVVATAGGFVVEDPDAVRAAVGDRDPSAAAVDDDGNAEATDGWSTADKLAGVAALGLMASYQVPVARDAVGSTAHLLFGPIEAALPFGATVALLAIATTVVSTTVRRRLLDENSQERLTARMNTVEERLDAARERGDDEAVKELRSRQQELMLEHLGAMKQMIRPMIWAMLVTVPVFLWITWLTLNPAAAITPAAQVLPLAGRVVWTARLVGPLQVWTAWYIACSVLSGVLGKRVAKRVRPVVADYRSSF
ncbi:HTR-like protein [Halobacteriales archaeon QH_8_67_27]|nr:MAG: HTR-like protein [Halobacteriales archaeon QH_8_67_27]